MRILLKIAGGLLAVWLVASVALFALMWLPPGRFAGVISHVPGPLLLRCLPFQYSWTIARSGSLRIGDPAPEFNLERHDKSGRVRLSALSGRPVVLVFGSYT